MNETTIAEESGKTHDYTQECVYLGIRKDGKALNRGHALMHIAHANMEIHYKRKSTHESIDRRNTAEKHKHRHTMEANNEQTDHKNTCAIQHKTERARITIKRESAKQEGFSHYNTNIKK